MHSVLIASVGKTKETWLELAWQEYAKRLVPFLKLETLWLSHPQDLENFLDKHPKALLLDPDGQLLDSRQWHDRLYSQSLLNKGKLELVIGSDMGFSDERKKQAKVQNRLLSLSRLTFTHQICRLLLIEQLYRATQIQHNLPYHK